MNSLKRCFGSGELLSFLPLRISVDAKLAVPDLRLRIHCEVSPTNEEGP